FFQATATSVFYTLSLHDALPIFVRKSGAWYTYEGDQLGQGKENARAFLRDNPELADDIERRIKEKLGVGQPILDVTDEALADMVDRKSTRLNSSHSQISYAVFCL